MAATSGELLNIGCIEVRVDGSSDAWLGPVARRRSSKLAAQAVVVIAGMAVHLKVQSARRRQRRAGRGRSTRSCGAQFRWWKVPVELSARRQLFMYSWGWTEDACGKSAEAFRMGRSRTIVSIHACIPAGAASRREPG